MRILTWNTRWASPQSRASRWMHEVFLRARPDIVVLTEARGSGTEPWGGHVMCAGADWGYPPRHASERKSLAWSRQPWVDVATHEEHQDLPRGRLVTGTTQSPAGPIRVIAVCVPWAMAHVSTGQRNRRPWQDHLAFLQGLQAHAKQERARHEHVVIAGDFNQTLPRTRAPVYVHTALRSALEGFQVTTEGLKVAGRPVIDHVAIGGNGRVRSWSSHGIEAEHEGRRVSDHDLLIVKL